MGMTPQDLSYKVLICLVTLIINICFKGGDLNH